MSEQWENNESIKLLREYLQIPSVHPDVDYEPCVIFLKKVADSIGLRFSVYRCHPKKPVVIMTWPGANPILPAILLNSHMDVVPVSEDSWIYPPFEAHIDDSGKIYARGSQDMKSIAIQFIEAVREMKEAEVVLQRTVHLSFVPDEEIGGALGMKLFVQSDAFRALNVGFCMDEGDPSTEDHYDVYYDEKVLWSIEITCNGQPGHGSSLQPDTAAEKARLVIDKFTDFRNEQREKEFMEATSVNLTILQGGVQSNVIPDKIKLGFDVRVAVNQDHDEMEALIRKWCEEAGENVNLEFKIKDPYVQPTVLDETNKFWVAYKQATDELEMTLVHKICPGVSDSRYLRQLNIPAIGMSPINRTEYLLHDHNEYIEAETFLKGIQIFKRIIENVANVL
ncbi:aminoacylase-1A-like [Ctenocephalides felis]|uniref:aminoacylase-1A-like n=1 Tax=Ctenocephalides felis TaxID=7515 RepID=UPI000E6E437B|nr:aminoacylase-1A-like [Ctenocephalides felis]